MLVRAEVAEGVVWQFVVGEDDIRGVNFPLIASNSIRGALMMWMPMTVGCALRTVS